MTRLEFAFLIAVLPLTLFALGMMGLVELMARIGWIR